MNNYLATKVAGPLMLGLMALMPAFSNQPHQLFAQAAEPQTGVVQFWQVVPEGQTKPTDMTESELRNLLYCKVNHNLTGSSETTGKQNTYINSCYVDEGYYLGETDSSYRVLVSGYEGYLPKTQTTKVTLGFSVDAKGNRVSSGGTYTTYSFNVLTTAEFIPAATESGGMSLGSEADIDLLEFDEYLKEPTDFDSHLSQAKIRTLQSSVAVSPSYYTVSNGMLYHYISRDVTRENYYSKIVIGNAPSFMTSGTRYYSYDGLYFYTDLSQINVLGSGAVNAGNPYYNYYQYLPIRSESNLGASAINNYLTSAGYTQKPTSTSTSSLKAYQSVLSGEGSSFADVQETYHINGALQFAMGIHESAFGRSSISVAKNNLFGINAVDLNPAGQADKFDSAKASIDYHAQRYLSWGYSDPLDDNRYYGFYLGNKAGGMNVSYASDPFWGEKIAGHYFQLDKANGLIDYNGTIIGVVSGNQKAAVYSAPSTTSSVLYYTWNGKAKKTVQSYPVQIVGESGDFYVIKPDTPINSKGVAQYDGAYADDTVAYILKSQVSGLNQTNVPGVGEDTTPTTPTVPEVPELDLTVTKTGYAKTGGLNIRRQPSTSGDPLGTFSLGEAIQLVRQEGDWYLINYNGAAAYVSARYISTEVLEQTPEVTPPTEPEAPATPETPAVEDGMTWQLPPLTIEAGSEVNWLSDVSVQDTEGQSYPLAVKENSVNLKRPGQYEVVYTATLKSRDVLEETRTVVVVDTTAPTLTLSGDKALDLEVGMTYSEPGYQTKDNAEGAVSVTVSQPLTGMKTVGTYQLAYTARDAANNVTTDSRTVTVSDTTAPTITLKGSAEMTLTTDQVYEEAGYTTADEGGNVTVTVQSILPSPLSVGTYSITYVATDEAGLTAQATRIIKVVAPPVVETPKDPAVTDPKPETTPEVTPPKAEETPKEETNPTSPTLDLTSTSNGYSTTEGLNIRDKASTSGAVLGRAALGDTLKLVKQEGDWYLINYNGVAAYVSATYVSKSPVTQTETPEVTTPVEKTPSDTDETSDLVYRPETEVEAETLPYDDETNLKAETLSNSLSETPEKETMAEVETTKAPIDFKGLFFVILSAIGVGLIGIVLVVNAKLKLKEEEEEDDEWDDEDWEEDEEEEADETDDLPQA